MNIAVVGGAGHVGLPLSLAFARAGFNVWAYDLSESLVKTINSGVMPFMEIGAEQVLKQVIAEDMFRATTNSECLRSADIIFVVVGTPAEENLDSDSNSVVETISNLKNYLNPNQLILLRSTVYPGVARRVEKLLESELPGIAVAYCPERIIEGHALSELTSLPQIIGARTVEVFDRTSKLFEALAIKTLMTTPEEAELAKLFTNVWRYIKFATANQFFMMANDLHVDYENVRKAITFEYPRAADLPKSGFTAGPCLLKDTLQLSELVQHKFPLGQSAIQVNQGMPEYLVAKLSEIYDLSSTTIGILGMAFKADIDDTRDSLAYTLRDLLSQKAKQVITTDPFVKDNQLLPLEDVIARADLLVIGAPHSDYLSLNLNKPLVDIWGVMGNGVLV